MTERFNILPTKYLKRRLLVTAQTLRLSQQPEYPSERTAALTSGARSENRLNPIRRAAGTPVAVKCVSLDPCRNK